MQKMRVAQGTSERLCRAEAYPVAWFAGAAVGTCCDLQPHRAVAKEHK
jgi:hypothetical protein